MMKNYCLLSLIAVSLPFMWGCSTGPRVEFVPHETESRIDVMVGGKHFTSYLYGAELPKPVLFPLRTPSGVMVTRGYPLARIEGESIDHPHHMGLFFAYNIHEDAFWSKSLPIPPPQIKHLKVTKMVNGFGKGKLSTIIHWIDRNGAVLLEESRDMIFRAGEDEYIIDFDIDLKALDKKVEFGDTKEGMFAIRVADWLRGGDTGEYLNCDGQRKEANVWGRRARWVRLEGTKDGKTIGIAILNHPTSVNYPTYSMARGYGLFSANPLGQRVYQETLKQENPQEFNLTLEPGKSAHFGFRVIIYEGSRTQEQLEQEFTKFAK